MPEVISTNTYRLRQAQISAVDSIGYGRLMQTGVFQDAEKPAGKAERAEAILFSKALSVLQPKWDQISGR